ncbi:hypothetical protein [Sandaracinus amylolyticus]|uniref:HTH tetR-type domain-containing protein n=1 Tax=Sandaracinus amylolyticus TaxID=927083 RepID=A0A0F6SFD9_9BACT|nr:hypothetical protein DB32_003923 [Sandaracinus amylolyticus]
MGDIAARAGLTERTFFRRFTDEREVLFSGSQELEGLVVSAVAAAPSGLARRARADRAPRLGDRHHGLRPGLRALDRGACAQPEVDARRSDPRGARRAARARSASIATPRRRST